MSNISRATHKSEKFYDRLTVLYPIIDVFLRPQKLKFFTAINRLRHGRLLEIGVGNGAHFKYYRTHEITGIDTSKSMLARAQKHLKDNIQLIHMNGENLSFADESFDYVILSHVIAVVDDPEKMLDEVHRVLKPEGRVFILNHITPNNWLKYIDRLFASMSSLLHFRSVFHISRLQKLQQFKLLQQIDAGFFSYFKILVYEKNR